jgi:hypothetical protein
VVTQVIGDYFDRKRRRVVMLWAPNSIGNAWLASQAKKSVLVRTLDFELRDPPRLLVDLG